MKGLKRQWLRDIVGGDAIYNAVYAVLDAGFAHHYMERHRAAIRDVFGDKILASLPTTVGNRHEEVMILRRQLLELFTQRFPGIIHSCSRDHTDSIDKLYPQQSPDSCCKTWFERACEWGRYDYAHQLLDFGATATSFACDLLVTHEINNVLGDGKRHEIMRLIKRMIRHGAFCAKKNPHPRYVAYKNEYESTRDAALILIGIRKFRKSPLVPDGVHCEIIKAIAYRIRQTCERDDIGVRRKKIKV